MKRLAFAVLMAVVAIVPSLAVLLGASSAFAGDPLRGCESENR